MAKDTAIEAAFSFAGGLNTEASALNYPPNASLDELNFDLKRNGSREKRLGMDKRSTDTYSSAIYTSPDNIAIQSYLWENIGAGVEEVVHVIQIGRYLYFYARNVATSTIISAAGPTSTIDLSTYAVSSDVELYKVQFTEGKGYLIVAGRVIDPFYLTYDFDNNGVFEAPLFITGSSAITLDADAAKSGTFTVYDSIGEQVAVGMQDDSYGGDNYLYIYDENDGTVTTKTITTVSGAGGPDAMLFWSTGDSGTSNNRLLYLTNQKVSIYNTSDWSNINNFFVSFTVGFNTFRETNDFIVYTNTSGTADIEAWDKSETSWSVTNQSVPVGYTHKNQICQFEGRDYVLAIAQKTATGDLAAYKLTPSALGGTINNTADWTGISFVDIDAFVHDSTDDVCWALTTISGTDTLIKCQTDGTYLSQISLGTTVGFSYNDGNVGNNMIYDENTHSLYISYNSNIYVYDIAASNYYALGPSISTTGTIAFSNKYGNFYEGRINYNNTQALIIHSVETEQPVIGNKITINVRDFEGLNDGYETGERRRGLSGITAKHEYNLLNQGWPTDYPCVVNAGDEDDEDTSDFRYPLQETYLRNGWWPSNADQVQLGKASNVVRAKRINYFSAEGLETNIVGNTQAPRGHFIYNAFNVNRSGKALAMTGTTSATDDTTTNERPSTVAFYAGRIFYSGVNDEEYNDKVYFSQVLENIDFIGKCYQEADPTSETISDLVATDGGVIPLAGAKSIVLLKVVEDSLIVGATNGVWQIRGASDSGFSALDYQAIKISSNGIRNPHSAVDAEGTFLYWSDGGIYAIVPDPQTGKISSRSLTVDTIQTYYNNITAEGKESAVGHYNNTDKKVIWLYKDSVETYNILNKALFFDPLRQAFYPYEFEAGTDVPRLIGIDDYIIGTSTAGTYNVVTQDGDTVQTASGTNDVVITTEGLAKDIEKSVHYLSLWYVNSNWTYTYSDLTDTEFKDWADTGSDYYYDAYVETGYKVNNDAVRAKQTPYIGVACERTETNWSFVDDGEDYINPSSCLLSAYWDFYENTASNKWVGPHQVYRLKRYVTPIDDSTTFDNLYPDVVVTKNKVRGRGKSLRLKFEADDGKDLKLLGWQIFWSGNTTP